jgi:general secretion pathway protein D
MSLHRAARTDSAPTRWVLAIVLASALGGCAAGTALRVAHSAEQAQDYDRAVVEYRKALRTDPGNREARISLERVRLRAAQEHLTRGRQLAGSGR